MIKAAAKEYRKMNRHIVPLNLRLVVVLHSCALILSISFCAGPVKGQQPSHLFRRGDQVVIGADATDEDLAVLKTMHGVKVVSVEHPPSNARPHLLTLD